MRLFRPHMIMSPGIGRSLISNVDALMSVIKYLPLFYHPNQRQFLALACTRQPVFIFVGANSSLKAFALPFLEIPHLVQFGSSGCIDMPVRLPFRGLFVIRNAFQLTGIIQVGGPLSLKLFNLNCRIKTIHVHALFKIDKQYRVLIEQSWSSVGFL